ncbi:MAG: DNA-processing protein DprA [Collinsella sp.]|nr:DNA-processing protein DprA [Collinsella sp.]
MSFDVRQTIPRGEDGYPAMLADLDRPPERIFVLGDVSVLAAPSISIIGARRASPYGLAIADMAARVAAEAGIVVTSGGAMGCDRAAGISALDAGGRHVIVMGTGADVVYPRSSRSLVERTLSQGGAVVSLEPWGSPPRRYAFPKRNRIIAALSLATLVVEAGMPSGTFGTAETAAELGREVLSVPGSILSPESRGSNHLISIGATCIADLEALEMAISRIYGTLRREWGAHGEPAFENELERSIFEALVASPLRADELVGALGAPALNVARALGALTARGMVSSLCDGRHTLTRSALHAASALGHNVVRANH